MRFEVHLPCSQLLPYIKHLIVSENENAATYTVLPDTALVIGFQYSGRLSYIEQSLENPLSPAGITGLRDSCRVFQNTAGIGSILVVFRENGVAPFLKMPLNELFGKSVSLEHFFCQSDLTELQEKLMGCNTDQCRISSVEQFLIHHLTDHPLDLMVSQALKYIHQSNGTIRINELAKLLNTSASPLEKQFRRVVGASPKKFATIVRAKNVLDAMDNGKQGYAEYLSSFYDQAHFIKDFKKFASVTPEQYLKNLR
ncbi:helix-turn-helix domain-containing protein [Pedobacter sp. PWIIR3]